MNPDKAPHMHSGEDLVANHSVQHPNRNSHVRGGLRNGQQTGHLVVALGGKEFIHDGTNAIVLDRFNPVVYRRQPFAVFAKKRAARRFELFSNFQRLGCGLTG